MTKGENTFGKHTAKNVNKQLKCKQTAENVNKALKCTKPTEM